MRFPYLCPYTCFVATSKHLDASPDLYSMLQTFLSFSTDRDDMRCSDVGHGTSMNKLQHRTRSFSTAVLQASLLLLESRGSPCKVPRDLCPPPPPPPPPPTKAGSCSGRVCPADSVLLPRRGSGGCDLLSILGNRGRHDSIAQRMMFVTG